jgi:hypothetical protein
VRTYQEGETLWEKTTRLVLKAIEDETLRKRLQESEGSDLAALLEAEGFTPADREAVLEDIRKLIPDPQHPGALQARSFW